MAHASEGDNAILLGMALTIIRVMGNAPEDGEERVYTFSFRFKRKGDGGEVIRPSVEWRKVSG